MPLSYYRKRYERAVYISYDMSVKHPNFKSRIKIEPNFADVYVIVDHLYYNNAIKIYKNDVDIITTLSL